MSRAPFATVHIEQRLRQRVAELRHVGGASDYAQVQSLSSFPAPAAYVVLIGEDDADPVHSPRSVQAMRVTLGVVLAVRNLRMSATADAHASARDELAELLDRCRAALMGWQPSAPSASALRLAAGQLLDWDASTLLWADTYTMTHVLRSGP